VVKGVTNVLLTNPGTSTSCFSRKPISVTKSDFLL